MKVWVYFALDVPNDIVDLTPNEVQARTFNYREETVPVIEFLKQHYPNSTWVVTSHGPLFRVQGSIREA